MEGLSLDFVSFHPVLLISVFQTIFFDKFLSKINYRIQLATDYTVEKKKKKTE